MVAMRRQTSFLVVVAAAIVLIAMLRTVSPGHATIREDYGDSRVQFSSSRPWVIQTGDCVILTWESEGIQAIYWNDEPTVGSEIQEFCPTLRQNNAAWRVIYPDGISQDYVLSIGTIATAPEMWLLLALAAAFLFGAAYTLFAERLRKPSQRAAKFMRPAWKVARLVMINLLIVAVLLEIGLRIYFGSFGTEQQRGMYLYSADEIWRSSQASRLPFLNYALNEGASNNLGYNDPDDIILPKPDGVFRIVALGGSTTYGLLVEPEQAYPAQLERLLREEYGYENVEVINAGVIGYDSWNSVVNLEFRVLELQPDMIIIYHATNDIQPREQLLPDCYQGINIHRGLNPEAAVLQLQAQQISPSTLQRFLFINLGWMDNPIALSSSFEQTIPCYYESQASELPMSERLDANPPTYFERNMRTMIIIAQGYDMQVMLSTWAYDSAIAAPYGEEHWRRGIAQHNAITTELAQEYDTLYYDLAASEIADSSDYWLGDYTHQSAEGHHLQASLYAAYLAETGVLP
ncbi:MAG: hypothetical protein KC496_05215, partial [Anaerolineae bacterium]|nr:hypothetical protein [Anaerolineae bacterium]